MATPKPSPQSSPNTTNVNGVAVPQVPAAGSSLYGSGAWATAPLTVGASIPGFPTIPVNSGSDAVKAFAQLQDPNTIQSIQQMLYYGGFYGTSTQPSDIIFGKIRPDDIKAMQAAAQTSVQAGTPLDSYLTSMANWGKAGNILTNASKIASQRATITHPATANVDAALRSAAESLLGHDVSADEYAKFRAFFDQAYTQGQRDTINAQNQQTTLGAMPSQGDLAGAIGTLNQPAGTKPVTGQPNVFGFDQTGGAVGIAAPTVPPSVQAAAQHVIDQTDQSAQTAAQPADVAGAPDVGAAAEQFLRQNNAAGVAQQNVATKYQTLLGILGGSGS